MCTATWFFTEHGYELFFNRDELRARRRALPPTPFTAETHRALAPTDADAGGTWLAGNEQGLTVALLNRYQDSADPTTADRRRSRGLLVRDLAASADADDLRRRLETMDLSLYAPFTLLVLTADTGRAVTCHWDGRRLSAAREAVAPLASSGHEPLTVPLNRRDLWSRIAKVDRDACLTFHRSHEPERGAQSPCMHRYDARTVSLTHVEVAADRVRMAYADGPPCTATLEPAAELDRAGRSAASLKGPTKTAGDADAA